MRKIFAILVMLLICVACVFSLDAYAVMSDGDFLELCKSGTAREVEVAIKNGANVNARNEYGGTALMWAGIANPNPEVISVLLENGADVNDRDEFGSTVLMLAAAENSNPEVISVLVKNGADVNINPEGSGWTALMWAVQYNSNPKIVSILLDSGADASVRDSDGKRPIDYASENANLINTDVYQQLLAATNAGTVGNLNAANTPEQARQSAATSDEYFLQLCESGTAQEVEAAIKDGANVNAKDENGETALMYAARSNRNPEVVSVLLENGANASIKDNQGRNAVDFASINSRLKNADVYQQLIEASNENSSETAATVESSVNVTELIQPGIYSINNEYLSGELNLSYVNNKYEASINLGYIHRPAYEPVAFEGTAVIEGNKMTIKGSGDPEAQIVITVKDGTAIFEANDKAEASSYFEYGCFSGTYQARYYKDRSAARVGDLVHWGSIPQYIQDRGKFSYDDNYAMTKITGDNVRLRSQPNTDARVVAYVNRGEILGYQGEWTNPQGEKWILATYYNEEIHHYEEFDYVWVYNQFTELITLDQFFRYEW